MFKRECFSSVTDDEWEEYKYLYELIELEKRSPYKNEYHPLEDDYVLMKKIAASSISCNTLRNGLVIFLEQEQSPNN